MSSRGRRGRTRRFTSSSGIGFDHFDGYPETLIAVVDKIKREYAAKRHNEACVNASLPAHRAIDLARKSAEASILTASPLACVFSKVAETGYPLPPHYARKLIDHALLVSDGAVPIRGHRKRNISRTCLGIDDEVDEIARTPTLRVASASPSRATFSTSDLRRSRHGRRDGTIRKAFTKPLIRQRCEAEREDGRGGKHLLDLRQLWRSCL